MGRVFVDHQLRILRFTPAASAIINLLPSDTGRPVGDWNPGAVRLYGWSEAQALQPDPTQRPTLTGTTLEVSIISTGLFAAQRKDVWHRHHGAGQSAGGSNMIHPYTGA